MQTNFNRVAPTKAFQPKYACEEVRGYPTPDHLLHVYQQALTSPGTFYCCSSRLVWPATQWLQHCVLLLPGDVINCNHNDILLSPSAVTRCQSVVLMKYKVLLQGYQPCRLAKKSQAFQGRPLLSHQGPVSRHTPKASRARIWSCVQADCGAATRPWHATWRKWQRKKNLMMSAAVKDSGHTYRCDTCKLEEG
jgi:hypothetical protein